MVWGHRFLVFVAIAKAHIASTRRATLSLHSPPLVFLIGRPKPIPPSLASSQKTPRSMDGCDYPQRVGFATFTLLDTRGVWGIFRLYQSGWQSGIPIGDAGKDNNPYTQPDTHSMEGNRRISANPRVSRSKHTISPQGVPLRCSENCGSILRQSSYVWHS